MRHVLSCLNWPVGWTKVRAQDFQYRKGPREEFAKLHCLQHLALEKRGREVSYSHAGLVPHTEGTFLCYWLMIEKVRQDGVQIPSFIPKS